MSKTPKTQPSWIAEWRGALLHDEEPTARHRPRPTRDAPQAPLAPTQSSRQRPAPAQIPAWAPAAPLLIVVAWIMLLVVALSVA